MNVISEAVAKWQVERLESLIAHARSQAKRDKLRSDSLVSVHLNLSDEHLDEAISALKYKRYDQASYACQTAFFQLGLAELLLHYGARLDAGIKKAMTLTGSREKVPEEEELAAYLASMLAEMKAAIEYSHCQVSDRAHLVLDHAMDYYNDALAAIKSSEAEKAKNNAQAGLLSLLLSSKLIASENQMGLPGWRGLSNPMLVGPLRRANQLVGELAETRQRLHRKEQARTETVDKEEADKNVLLRKHWEKAYNDLFLAIRSLADGSTAHAQALLKGSLREMEVVRDIIGIDDPDELQEELQLELTVRTPVADAFGAMAEIKDVLVDATLPRKKHILELLGNLEERYKEGIKYYEKARYEKAEKAVSDALLQLDLARQQVHFRKQKFTGVQKTI